MKCEACQRKWPDEFQHCPLCGAALSVQPHAEKPTFDQQEQQVDRQINVGRDYIDQRPTAPPPAACLDSDDALTCYLAHVIEAHRQLKLQGIRSATGLVSIDLEEVYVTLTATVRKTVQEQDAWIEEMAGLAPGEARRLPSARRGTEGGRLPSARGGTEGGTVQQVKVQVQEALALYPRLVVLGDPGSGKTTLLRYLALTYARDLASLPVGGTEGGTLPSARGGTEGGIVKQRLNLTEHRLPILLPLRDFARYLETEHPDIGADGPKLLRDYLRIYFQNQDIPLPPDFFIARLKAGACVILLDGVDEVASVPLRQRVGRLIERFTLAYPDNRYVVTSRIVGYTEGARLSADFEITTARDFTDADIARFVNYWNRAVEIVLTGQGEATPHALREAERQSANLLAAIAHNERVRELAVNPLLLTVIALVHRYRAQLPDRRVELYEEAIEVLLVQWDAVKGLAATAVLQGLELDAGDRRSMLEPVALWMMEQRVKELELDDLRRLLGPPFHTLLKDWRQTEKAVNGFVHLINARSGLLTERGMGIYAFSHLTFQEHLAARAVADREDYVTYTLDRVGDSWWREVILLEAGYLSTQGKRRVTELIQAVMDCAEEPEPYHNLVLAAEALRDVGQARTVGDLAGEVQTRLRAAFETPLRKGSDLKSAIQRRAAAAEALAQVESGTFGAQPAFWTLPWGVPVFVEVPAGEFWMGSERGDSDEKPLHKVHLDRYWIARVPVTNAQYHIFVEDAQHHAPSHWENGRVPRGLASHPVVNVSWRDALAYCRWMTEKLNVAGCALSVWRENGMEHINLEPATFNVQLPSEAEWEKAARGGLPSPGRGGAGGGVWEYPWGDDWQEGHCNSNELGVGETTPVGIFPEGSSPYGCLDMVGNVWEWTRSLWGFEYPYKVGDERENLEAGDDVARVLRGGAFYVNPGYARCAYRFWIDPDLHLRDGGFRVVVSPSRL